MKMIGPNTAEFTDEEMIVKEIHELLLDQGFGPGQAMIMIRGAEVPEGMRSPSPNLDRVLTPMFVDWLTM